MKAMNAAVPSPTPSASKPMTPASSSRVRAMHMRRATRSRGSRRPARRRTATAPRLMPILTIQSPPSSPPMTLAHSPAFFAIRPISDHGEAHVEIERRRQRGGHAVAELVEKDEAEHQQRLRQPCARDELVKRLDHRLAQRLRRVPCATRGSRTNSVIAMPGSMNSAVIEEHAVPGQVIGEDQRQRARHQARACDRRCTWIALPRPSSSSGSISRR